MSLTYDTFLPHTSEVMARQRAQLEERTHVVDVTWAALVTVDSDCRIRAFNREAERITGLSTDAVLGQRACEVLFPVSSGSHAACPWQRAVQGAERRVYPREV